jgi:hypothetical protein
MLEILVLPAAVVVLALMAFGVAIVPPLVHIAIKGVLAAQPYKIAGQVIQPYDHIAIRQVERDFNWVVVALALTTVASCVCFIQLVRIRAATARRALYVVAFGACLLVSAGLSLWIRIVGLDAVSPFIAQTQFTWPWYHGLGVVLLLGLASGVAAGRILLLPVAGHEADSPLLWRTRAAVYWNENRAVLFFLGAANVAFLVADAYPFSEWLLLSLEPDSAGRVAVIWLCVRGFMARRDEIGERLLQSGIRVRFVPLLVTWAALLVLAWVSVEAIIWSFFAALTSAR